MGRGKHCLHFDHSKKCCALAWLLVARGAFLLQVLLQQSRTLYLMHAKLQDEFPASQFFVLEEGSCDVWVSKTMKTGPTKCMSYQPGRCVSSIDGQQPTLLQGPCLFQHRITDQSMVVILLPTSGAWAHAIKEPCNHVWVPNSVHE